MIRVANILQAILVVLTATQSFAQSMSPKREDLSDQIITGAWSDPTKCNLTNARTITFLEAASGSGVAKGDCVAVTAYWSGRALFVSKADAKQKKSNISYALAGRRIGLYAQERIHDLAPKRPSPFKIVGVYASCATEWPGAMMVLGYCHYTDGPFIKVSQAMAVNSR